ncbi:AMP binding enzyme [Ceratobasidium sp. AG-Ba]|nr:AMP binding enzyme [Ceratobasidium sp. AG-Ba]
MSSMPAPRVYRSRYPDYAIPRQSVYSKLFPKQPLYDESSPAYIEATTGRTLTRGDVRDMSLKVACGIRNLLKTKKGDFSSEFYSPNSLTWPLVLFGCVAAGLRCTLANTSYTPPELAHQLKDSGAGYVFVHPALVPTLLQAFEILKVPANEAKKRAILMSFGEEPPRGMAVFMQFDSLLKIGKLEEEERFDGDMSDETVYLCYSSGTTGLSKGVETTHHNINTVLTCCRALFPGMYPGRDVMLGILPFYHIYGAVGVVQYPFTLGVPVVISPPFNPEEFCFFIQKYRITCALIVPPILVVLASHPAVDKYNLSTLRFFFSGAAPLGADLVTRVRARLRKQSVNVSIIQGYGLTETSPTCLILNIDWAEEKVGSAGELLPNMEARLVGSDGRDVKDGEPGEFWLRAPSVMKGYLNNPLATRNSITTDGWFKTGDIAIRDKDGFFTIVDRLKELIKYKGFQVPPADLENVLLTHPDVIDAGVVGIYSEEQATELPRAYVVNRAGFASLSKSQREAFAKDVQTWIQGKVAKHKFLRGGVVVVEAIPKSAAGKILRRELRELAKKELVEAGSKAKL